MLSANRWFYPTISLILVGLYSLTATGGTVYVLSQKMAVNIRT
jgi:hypothetical protein